LMLASALQPVFRVAQYSDQLFLKKKYLRAICLDCLLIAVT